MSTMTSSGERTRIETVIQQQASKTTYWQQVAQALQSESESGQLSPHYRIVGMAFQQAERQLDNTGKMGVQALPPNAQAAAFELGASVTRIAETLGEDTANQVASFLCSAIKHSAKSPHQQ